MSLSSTFTGSVKSVSEFILRRGGCWSWFCQTPDVAVLLFFMFSVYANSVLRDWQRFVLGSQQVFVGHFGSLINCCLLQGI